MIANLQVASFGRMPLGTVLPLCVRIISRALLSLPIFGVVHSRVPRSSIDEHYASALMAELISFPLAEAWIPVVAFVPR
jgi:hypothetical protein